MRKGLRVALIPVLAVPLFGFSSCPQRSSMNYGALWSAYLEACKLSENQLKTTVYGPEGRVLYEDNKGCRIPQPPQPTAQRSRFMEYALGIASLWVQRDVGVRTVEAQRDLGVVQARENRALLEAAFKAAGHKVGRDYINIGGNVRSFKPDQSQEVK